MEIGIIHLNPCILKMSEEYMASFRQLLSAGFLKNSQLHSSEPITSFTPIPCHSSTLSKIKSVFTLISTSSCDIAITGNQSGHGLQPEQGKVMEPKLSWSLNQELHFVATPTATWDQSNLVQHVAGVHGAHWLDVRTQTSPSAWSHFSHALRSLEERESEALALTR